MNVIIGNFLLDVSKLIIGGLVLSKILKLSDNDLIMISGGVFVAIVFAIGGLMFHKKK